MKLFNFPAFATFILIKVEENNFPHENYDQKKRKEKNPAKSCM